MACLHGADKVALEIEHTCDVLHALHARDQSVPLLPCLSLSRTSFTAGMEASTVAPPSADPYTRVPLPDSGSRHVAVSRNPQ
jgi:hypothetical protein